jgi:hypothetical protein
MSTALVTLGALLALGGGCEGEPVNSQLSDTCVGDTCGPDTPPAEAPPNITKPLNPSDPEICADVTASFEAQIPTVMLLLDQSGSMTAHFDGTNRWNAMYDALMHIDEGVIPTLAGDVRFGLALYTSYNGGESCPVLTEVAPMMENYDAIDAVFASASPQDDTPTGEAIEALVPLLDAVEAPGKKLILLATDGEPDSCEIPDPQMGQARAIAGAQYAYDAGIEVVVLAVGSQLSEGHQQDMANAGAGLPVPANCGECAEYYRPDSTMSLVDDFNTIINGARSCTFSLDGEVVTEHAGDGTVTLNGEELGYGDPDGWRLVSPTEIEVTGKACDEIMDGGNDNVEGTFPCYAFIEPLY